MYKLADIFEGIDIVKVRGSLDVEFGRIQSDSRKLSSGDMFVAIRGIMADGHDHIQEAVESGVNVVVCEQLPQSAEEGITYVLVKSTHQVLGLLASAYYGHPSRQLRLVGVTGTNGKTSVVSLLHEIFESQGIKSGLISTIKILVHKEELQASYTTPDALSLQELLGSMLKAGCRYVFMEVSSHAIDQDRIAGAEFAGALFTNITHDHLDYHGSTDNYIRAKKKFFDNLGTASFALLNSDDRRSRFMVQNTKAKISFYGLKTPGGFKGRIIESSIEASYISIDNTTVWVPFIGEFNIYNILAAYGASVLLGLEKDDVLRSISKAHPAPGRFETIRSEEGKLAIIDYAHTPDALMNVLKTINSLRKEGSEIICILGAGGDRDKLKRPEMGKIGAEYSDRLILTSDNPRSEDPGQIINDIKIGIPQEMADNTLMIVDRKEAIKTACMMAKAGDIILIAGKGHETYQLIGNERLHHDDREEVRRLFKTDEKTA